jgi:hypothetical protein
MILMRLTHIEKRLERLMTCRSKRHRTATPRRGSNNKKLRKRKANRS